MRVAVLQAAAKIQYDAAHHPLVSSSSGVLQAALQCNSDVQLLDRCACRVRSRAQILYGMRSPSRLRAFALRVRRVGMKAAFMCDVYMTKYHAKAQQVFSSALPWLMQGIRRYAQADLPSDEPAPLPERALKQLRRMQFVTNRCHCFSATEVSIFVLTGGGCIQTHSNLHLFTYCFYCFGSA